MKSNSHSFTGTSLDGSVPTTLPWIAAMAAEGVAGHLFFTFLQNGDRVWWVTAAIAHLAAAVILLTMGGKRWTGIEPNNRFRIRFFGVLVLFLPVMGLVGSLTLQLLCDRWIRSRGLVEGFQEETAHRVVELERPEEKMDLKTYFDEELAVQPVLDILAGHDDNLKRGAIDTLRRIGTVEAAYVLKKCLSDTNPEVRYNAHAALTRIDESHTRQIKLAQQRLDTGIRTAEDFFQYAHCCSAYGASGLLDVDSRRHYFQMARDAFVTARDKGMPEMRLMLDLGRLEMALGDYGNASAYFRSILSREPGNASALVGLAEACFNSGDLTRLKAVAKQMKGAGPGSFSEEMLLNFWASPPKVG